MTETPHGSADNEQQNGTGSKSHADPSNEPPKQEDGVLTAEQEAAKKAEEDAAKAAEDEAKAKAEAEGEEGEGEEDEDDSDLDVDTWGDTKDEVGNSVLKLLQDSGITSKDAADLFREAVNTGDIGKVDRAKLEAAVGKTTATLILAGAENYFTRVVQREREIVQSLHDEAGGKANWDTIIEWSKKNLKTEEIQEYRDMISAGGRKAQLAARDLKALYEENNTSLNAGEDTVVPNRAGKAEPKAEPLSRAEYFSQLEKLSREGKLTDQVKQQLWARRQAGQRAGK